MADHIIWKRHNWLTPWRKCRRAMVMWWPWRKAPRIYIPWERQFVEGWDNPGRVKRTLDHERIHVSQWKQYGRLGFLWRYVRTRERLHLEAEAFAMSVRWWLEQGQQTVTVHVSGIKLRPADPIVHNVGTFPVVDYYARALKRGYWLWGITQDECAKAIRGWMNP